MHQWKEHTMLGAAASTLMARKGAGKGAPHRECEHPACRVQNWHVFFKAGKDLGRKQIICCRACEARHGATWQAVFKWQESEAGVVQFCKGRNV